MQADDIRWMREALSLAELAGKAGEVPVGAVVVQDAVCIGRGYNRPISSQDPTAHAEIVALRDAAQHRRNYRLPGSTLYVTIEPCTMCIGAMVHARVERLVFGAREPKAGAVCSHLQLLDQSIYNHGMEYTEGVLEEECRRLMTAFFKEKRK